MNENVSALEIKPKPSLIKSPRKQMKAKSTTDLTQAGLDSVPCASSSIVKVMFCHDS